ncbi:MAG: aminoacyl-tRNA hydrolase [Sulfuriflexus sp.]|nr:aminoacyl-tRNA hydrolase [Sulfuriflexus sp.]
MIRLSNTLFIPEHELEFSAIRAQGAGGQHVNKTSSAIQLRFDVRRSHLPVEIKQQILRLSDQRISSQGVVVIKAQTHRSQEKNRQDAEQRLQSLLIKALERKKPRRPTRPSKNSVKKRLEGKQQRGKLKNLRGRVGSSD